MSIALKFTTCILAAGLATTPALAGTTTFLGDTTGGPTFNRALQGNPPTALSAVGTDVNYAVDAFTVTLDGTYSFLATAGYDNFLHLYANTFDPNSPLNSILIGNDDFGAIGMSGFDFDLLAGVSYFAVDSAFSNGSAGAYSLTISGPGDIVGGNVGAVPEPAIWAFMILGFGLIGGAMRRQSKATVKVTYA